MSFYLIINFITMFLQFLCYLTNFLTFLFNVFWLIFNVASAGVPWITLLFCVLCIGSKFAKLRQPCEKRILSLFGKADGSIADDMTEYLFWPIANKGGDFDAPENSAAALKMCSTFKCKNVLLDLGITECGELVILDRNTLEKANINGPISNLQFYNLQNINISEHHSLGSQFQPEKILTLSNLLTLLEINDLNIFLLITEINNKLINTLKLFILKNNNFIDRIIICCKSPIVIYQLRKQFPDLICGLWMDKSTMPSKITFFKTSPLLTTLYGAFFRNIISPVIGNSIVFINKDEFNKNISELWRNAGVRPIVYFVNSPNEKRYFQQVTKTQYITDSLRSEPQLLLKKKKH